MSATVEIHRTASFELPVGGWMRSPLAIALVAFGLRFAFIASVMPRIGQLYGRTDWFGWETGRVAFSIAIGHGFASPFPEGPTGPTAWLPPVYAYLAAAIFK